MSAEQQTWDSVQSSAAKTPSNSGDWSETDEVRQVVNGAIGRGHAGKTALFRALSEGPLGEYFPSGLYLDVGNPQAVANMIREGERTRQLLSKAGLPPTMEASSSEYFLYSGDEQCVQFQIREVIGQILTHTIPDSDEQQQKVYNEYIEHLVDTDVIWTVIPCPPAKPEGRDKRRYMNDLRITNAYLKEVLRHRDDDRQVAVALVLSKVDTMFPEEDEAKEQLNDEILAKVLAPLVTTMKVSNKVSDAAIFPVSAFGFGKAVKRDRSSATGPAPNAAGSDIPKHDDEFDPFPSESVWLLKGGEVQEPYNLNGLVLWSLLFGLLNQDVDVSPKDEHPTADICRMLMSDFKEIEKWYVPIKGRFKNELKDG